MMDPERMEAKNWKSWFRDRALQYGCGYKACATYRMLFRQRCRAIERHYRNTKNRIILDCGSGNGLSTKFLTGLNTVVAIDNVFEMLPFARENGLKPAAGNLENGFPCKSGVFDSVAVISVLQYIRNTKQFLEEIRRVLKPGGEILLYSQNKASWLRTAFSFMNDSEAEEFRRTHQQLKTAMEESGFRYVKTLLLRFPVPSVGVIINPSPLQLGLAVSYILVGQKK